MKLNQTLALEAEAKRLAQAALVDAVHQVRNETAWRGLERTYTPLADDAPAADRLPPESVKVQITGDEVLAQLQTALGRFLDLTAAKDYANCEAKADISVGGRVLAPQVPVTYLLFLEKQLPQLEDLVNRLPLLSAAEEWHLDQDQGLHSARPVPTHRTKKVRRNHVLAEPTKEHPAQVEPYSEDVVEGTWTTVKFSGEFPPTRVRLLLSRIRDLQAAIKLAREEANMHQADEQRIGADLLAHLFG